MDGRIFSLIRHTRHQGFQGEIIVGGEFALDQANYFVKSGATAFLVDETNVETLTKLCKIWQLVMMVRLLVTYRYLVNIKIIK